MKCRVYLQYLQTEERWRGQYSLVLADQRKFKISLGTEYDIYLTHELLRQLHETGDSQRIPSYERAMQIAFLSGKVQWIESINLNDEEIRTLEAHYLF
jgi:hypothetical protein